MIAYELSKNAQDNFEKFINQFQPETKTHIERILNKLYRQNLSLSFKETCSYERLLPNYAHTRTHTHAHTHTHTHIYIYIYIYIDCKQAISKYALRAAVSSYQPCLPKFYLFHIYIYIYSKFLKPLIKKNWHYTLKRSLVEATILKSIWRRCILLLTRWFIIPWSRFVNPAH